VTAAPPRRSAIVLAGGRSRRFRSDKLAADIDGAPLIHHAVRAAAGTCDEVIVVLARDGLAPDLPAVPVPIRAVRDADPHPGPLAALLTGAHAAISDRLLIVGGDMPTLRRAVLERLLAFERGDGASLMLDDEPQVLPLALDRATVIAHAAALRRAGERSLRALLADLDTEAVPETEWRRLDPDGSTLRDVDRPEDLDPRR
jgi:molybdopterin-guanine dinucleotide biosynthesis protein A